MDCETEDERRTPKRAPSGDGSLRTRGLKVPNDRPMGVPRQHRL